MSNPDPRLDTMLSHRFLLLTLILLASLSWGQGQSPAPAKPVDALSGILDGFNQYRIVALSEGAHGSVQAHELLSRLLRDPRFPKTVNDIVVEWGNSRYQGVADRYVGGGEVTYTELRKIWQDTTQVSGVWDAPVFEEFFHTVRAVNASLPDSRKLRVLLGDPPIDWSTVKGPPDLQAQLSQRDAHPVAVIRTEVLAKNRRALIVYGGIHFLRKALYFPLPDSQDAEASSRRPVDSIVSRLEDDGETRVFSIWTVAGIDDPSRLQEDLGTWPVPSLARVANTALGIQPFVFLSPGVRMFRVVDGRPRGFDPDPERSHRVQDQFDAILYLGKRGQVTLSQRRPELCSDSKYVAMRVERLRITSGAGVIDAGAQFRNACVEAAKRILK